MRDVFISFATKDDDFARAATEYLEQHQLECWRCTRPEDNIPGTVWLETLARELMESGCVLLLHSASAESSDYVFREISMAVSLKKPILVVLLDESPMAPKWKFLLRTLQSLSAISAAERETWLERSLKSLRVISLAEIPLPVESIHNRERKVDLCQSLLVDLFESGPARLLAAAVKVQGVAKGYRTASATVEKQLMKLEAELASFGRRSSGKPCFFSIPIWAAEDLIVIFCGASPQDEAFVSSFLEQVFPAVSRLNLAGAELSVGVRLADGGTWRRLNGTSFVEDFFLQLGRGAGEKAPVAPPAPPPPESAEEETRQQDLSRRAARLMRDLEGRSSPTDLPSAMSFFAAEKFLQDLMIRK